MIRLFRSLYQEWPKPHEFQQQPQEQHRSHVGFSGRGCSNKSVQQCETVRPLRCLCPQPGGAWHCSCFLPEVLRRCSSLFLVVGLLFVVALVVGSPPGPHGLPSLRCLGETSRVMLMQVFGIFWRLLHLHFLRTCSRVMWVIWLKVTETRWRLLSRCGSSAGSCSDRVGGCCAVGSRFKFQA